MLKCLFSFSFQSILVWINLILFLSLFKKIKLEEKISVYILFLGFLFMQSIILFRYVQDTYLLNSEFFLLFSLSIFLKHLKINTSYIFGSIIILSLLLFSNFSDLKKLKKENITSLCYSLNQDDEDTYSFYKYWTGKIPSEKTNKFCIDYLS